MNSRQSDNPLSHKNGIPIDADDFVIRMPLRLLNNRSSSAQYNTNNVFSMSKNRFRYNTACNTAL